MTNEQSQTNAEVIKNTYYSKITLVTQIPGLEKKSLNGHNLLMVVMGLIISQLHNRE